MTKFLDIPADVLVYIMYAFDLSFADVVSFTGTCRTVRAVGRREFLEQYRFLCLRMKLMSPDDRDALDLNSATHIVLRWRLMRIYPVLRLRNPKRNTLRGCVLALCQFGVPTIQEPLSTWERGERRRNFADNRRVVLDVFGFDSSGSVKTPYDYRFKMTAFTVYHNMIERLLPEDVRYFVSVGWHARCVIFRLSYPQQCANVTMDDLDLERIEAQGHQDVLKHVLPHKLRFRKRPELQKKPNTQFASPSKRRTIYETHDMALLETVTNIDLIRLMVFELRKLNLMPEYVEKYEHLMSVKRTFADIAKDGRASYLAGESVDFNMLLNACVLKDA